MVSHSVRRGLRSPICSQASWGSCSAWAGEAGSWERGREPLVSPTEGCEPGNWEEHTQRESQERGGS